MSRKSQQHVTVRMSGSVLWNRLSQKYLQQQDWNHEHINEHVTVKGGEFCEVPPLHKELLEINECWEKNNYPLPKMTPTN